MIHTAAMIQAISPRLYTVTLPVSGSTQTISSATINNQIKCQKDQMEDKIRLTITVADVNHCVLDGVANSE